MENLNVENPINARLEQLKQETDPDFVIELIEIYLREVPILIQEIKSSIDTQNWQGLVSSAHKLKGSSLNVGAQSLASLSMKLEEMGKNGKMENKELVGQLESEFGRVKEVLQKLVNDL